VYTQERKEPGEEEKRKKGEKIKHSKKKIKISLWEKKGRGKERRNEISKQSERLFGTVTETGRPRNKMCST
jgi:hypothetical protein